MTSFSEGNINRASDGKFAAKTTGETDYETWSASQLDPTTDWEKALLADKEQDDYERAMRAAGFDPNAESNSPPAKRCPKCDCILVPGVPHHCVADKVPYWEGGDGDLGKGDHFANGIAAQANIAKRTKRVADAKYPGASTTTRSNTVLDRAFTKDEDGRGYTQAVDNYRLDEIIDEETSVNHGHQGAQYSDHREVESYVRQNIRNRFGGIRGTFEGSAEPNYSRIMSKGFSYNKDGTITQKVSQSDLNAIIEDHTQFFDADGNEQDERL